MEYTKSQINKLVALNKMNNDEEGMASLLKKNLKVCVEARQDGNQLYVQENHTENLHKNILWLFSKSIAFAPANSEELAQAFSNRSIILIHVYRFQECLIDIERAFKITSSDQLKSKLQARKKTCLSLMNAQSLNEQNSQESTNLNDVEQKSLHESKKDATAKLPEMIPSELLPCASESVALMYDEIFGRHFVATRDIEPGEVIIAEESYVCFPKNNHRYTTCSHCLKFSWNGIPCENCTVAMYCSESCKKEAWNQYHEIECSILPYLPFMHFDTEDYVGDVIIAVRLFIKAVKKEGLDSVLREAEAIDRAKEQNVTLLFSEILEHDTFRSFYNLSSSVQNNEDKDTVGDALLSKVINLLLSRTSIFDEKKNLSNDINDDFYIKIKQMIHNIRHVVNVNSFEYQGTLCICQDLDAPCTCSSNRGVVVAPFSSFINHSCASNVSRLFLPKKKIIMFTTAPVKKGDQLYDSYGPSLRMDRSTRQKLLLQNFHFTCKCNVCTDNWPTLQQLELVIDPTTESNIISQVMDEFKKYYPNESETFMFQESEDVWPFNEEALKKAVKISELIYKYCNNNIKAFLLSSYYKYYIDKAFYNLYGEKCRIASNCSEV